MCAIGFFIRRTKIAIFSAGFLGGYGGGHFGGYGGGSGPVRIIRVVHHGGGGYGGGFGGWGPSPGWGPPPVRVIKVVHHSGGGGGKSFINIFINNIYSNITYLLKLLRGIAIITFLSTVLLLEDLKFLKYFVTKSHNKLL